jgi:L-ascorbate metabolism protein UlaG (beta-lactamase superfamily)
LGIPVTKTHVKEVGQMSKNDLFPLVFLIFGIGLVGCAAPSTTSLAPTATRETTASLTWFGQSTFLLKTSAGLVVLLDPMSAVVGYALTPIDGVDVVTISHEHADHNNAMLANGSPIVLRGLTGIEWNKIDQTIKGARLRTVNTYHDNAQGSARGKNAVFVLEMDGLRIAHLGDLGHLLSADQLKEIGAVDAVMIPVGGTYTLDGKAATEVMAQLKPKIVIPMHYKPQGVPQSMAAEMAGIDALTAAIGSSAKIMQVEHTLAISSHKLPAEVTVMVMNYK